MTTMLPTPGADPDLDDEFDLDIRIGELASLHWHGMPVDAQTDGEACVPTGGRGAGTTCDTHNDTCPPTCAGLGTCPHTQCATCQETDCGETSPRTQCDTCVPRVCNATQRGHTCGTTCGCASVRAC